ncbi:stress response translation initiation inhibitor YciH [Candidatus Pacearchaeota archaeon]|nr:stress response translation initiation inhibitor YciH [Candidatus Pacearchaeota archaeon]|tara:strand:+ start:1308 stop:1607 length:300 start_codon:yes stop_codon:yes gene_type:complete
MDICPKCGLPLQACVCGEIAKTQQQISVKTEKRRFGKITTLVSGFDDGVDIKDIAKTLKAKRACGGTAKNKTIELQGNHKGRITPILVEMGFDEEHINE